MTSIYYKPIYKIMTENKIKIDDKFLPLIAKLDKWIEDFKRVTKSDYKIQTSKSGVWVYKELQPFGNKDMEGITIGVTDEYGEPTLWFNVWGVRGEIANKTYGLGGISQSANKIHRNNLGVLHTFKMTFPEAKYFWQNQMEEPLDVFTLKLMLRSDKQEYVNYELSKTS